MAFLAGVKLLLTIVTHSRIHRPTCSGRADNVYVFPRAGGRIRTYYGPLGVRRPKAIRRDPKAIQDDQPGYQPASAAKAM